MLAVVASVSSWANSPQELRIGSGALLQSGPAPAARDGSSRQHFAQQQPQPAAPARGETPKSPYAVEGMVLGSRVEFDSAAYRAYQCGPSEQFTGFTWCRRSRTERGPRGQVYSSSSILHSADGTIVYVNRALEPAFSSSADSKEEIQRIAQRYGAPKIIEMPRRAGLPDGVIAAWGDVDLQPVDPQNASQLAAGNTPALGFLIDFLADFQRSAKNGLAVYRIRGGAGYLWAASFGQNGRGTLRFLAVDPSKFSSPAPDQTAVAAQSPSPSPSLSPTPPAKPATEPELTVAELKQTIQTLQADLGTATTKIAELEKANAEAERARKQAEQARLAAENAKLQIEKASSADRSELDATRGAADAERRSWEILAYVAIVGLIVFLTARAAARRIRGTRERTATGQAALPDGSGAQTAPIKADAEKDTPSQAAMASGDTLGRELEKHVADINSARGETPA